MTTADAAQPMPSASAAPGDTVSVAEAAQRLGVHEKTLRRWIRTGRIPADLVDGPYGPQYHVPVSALSSAQQVLDVVKVERPTDPRTLALAVAQAVHHEHETLRAQLCQDLAEFKAEVLAALSTQPLTPQTAVDEPPATELVPPKQERQRRWWWPFPRAT